MPGYETRICGWAILDVLPHLANAYSHSVLVETEMVPVWRLLQREPGEDTPTLADWLKQRLEEWKTLAVVAKVNQGMPLAAS